MSAEVDPFNAGATILAHAARLSRKVALVHAGGTTTYGALTAMSARAAGAFRGFGVAQTDRVGLMLNDGPLYCASFLGLLQLGAVAIPINPRLSGGDCAAVCADAAIRLVIAESGYRDQLETAMRSCEGLRVVTAGDTPEGFGACVERAAPVTAFAATRPDDPAFWLFSSGTTGTPKGILHSHANCAQAGKLLRELLRADERSVILGTSRLFFSYGLDNAFLGPLSLGATTILNSHWPEPEQIVEQIEHHRPGIVFSVPTFYRRLLNLGRDRLQPLRAVGAFYSAGERLPDAIALAWRDALGADILSCYGMSETFCNAMGFAPGTQRLGATGRLLGGVEARLLGSDGAEVPLGEPGVMWIRHPALALRYSSPAATARSFRDRWFCSNDLFIRDQQGVYTHQGRADELMRVAGQWVKPGEIEEAVLADPELLEAACVVVPDRDGFERLALFVVPARSGEGEHRAATRCRDALPQHSRPKWIREIGELPKTSTGKIQRYRLRELLLADGKPEN